MEGVFPMRAPWCWQMALLLSTLIGSPPAIAAPLPTDQCNLSSFPTGAKRDRYVSPPPFVQTWKFQWGTKRYLDQGRNEVWNFVKNPTDNPRWTSGLTVAWNEAGITIPAINPLAEGGVFCNAYPVDQRPRLDTEAAIAIGLSSHKERAAVFTVRSPTTPLTSIAHILRAISTLSTTYRDEAGAVHTATITLTSSQEGSSGKVIVKFTPWDLKIGISVLPELITARSKALIMAQARSQGNKVELASLAKVGGYDAASELSPFSKLFPTQQLLFLTGAKKTASAKLEITYRSAGAPSTALGLRTADLVVLDAENRPVARGRVALVAPEPGR